MRKIAIIGAGIAGVSAAEHARKIDPAAEIKLFETEKYLPYYRLRLSEEIGKSFDPKSLYVHTEDWYKEKNILLYSGCNTLSINIGDKQIDTTSGRFSYDSLILAQGSVPFIPPIQGSDLEGVYTVRTMDDISNINELLNLVNNCVVIGGGVLGLETAWALHKAGIKVTVLNNSNILLNRQLDTEAANILTQHAEEEGLKILLGKETAKLSGKERAEAVELSDGSSISSDMVIFSTGIRPNLSLVKDTAININRFISVNERMETNVNGVFAAGDVAEYNGKSYGLWNISKEQGRVAGINAAGGEEYYQEIVPSNNLVVFGIKIFSAGDIGQSGSQLQSIVSHNNLMFKKLFFRDNELTGAIVFNDVKAGPILKKMIENKYQSKLSGNITPEEIIADGRNKIG